MGWKIYSLLDRRLLQVLKGKDLICVVSRHGNVVAEEVLSYEATVISLVSRISARGGYLIELSFSGGDDVVREGTLLIKRRWEIHVKRRQESPNQDIASTTAADRYYDP